MTVSGHPANARKGLPGTGDPCSGNAGNQMDIRMRSLCLPALLLVTACAPTVSGEPPVAVAASPDGYDLAAQRAKLAEVRIAPDKALLGGD